jgi:hypothetical protein
MEDARIFKIGAIGEKRIDYVCNLINSLKNIEKDFTK